MDAKTLALFLTSLIIVLAGRLVGEKSQDSENEKNQTRDPKTSSFILAIHGIPKQGKSKDK